MRMGRNSLYNWPRRWLWGRLHNRSGVGAYWGSRSGRNRRRLRRTRRCCSILRRVFLTCIAVPSVVLLYVTHGMPALLTYRSRRFGSRDLRLCRNRSRCRTLVSISSRCVLLTKITIPSSILVYIPHLPSTFRTIYHSITYPYYNGSI